mmetsp:Transcript_95122/g.157014  ORF Transcript_95122/g.157014 Transcript_95122/m.157014 type:complete len:378 (+) Transcript_95122:71-1204(+)
MRAIVLLLVHLACAGYTLRPQITNERRQGHFHEAGQPLQSLATVLLAFNPAAGFYPSSVAAARPAAAVRTTGAIRMMATLAAGANVLVYGNGPVQCLAARLAAIRGFNTKLITQAEEADQAKMLCFDEVHHPEGSIPLSLLPVSGPGADAVAVEEAVAAADGVIIAFDQAASLLSDKALNVFMPPESKIKHVVCMSRYLNGQGMGFFANAAKAAANPDVWNAPAPLVEAYKAMEKMVQDRAAEVGASFSFIRAGTLKGGACGELSSPEQGENSFLNPSFYKLGQQDLVNWRLLYDVNNLGVEISKGDTLPGPGFWAALTSRDSGGDGESHRGAVAAALVETFFNAAAQNSDFSVKTVESRTFPSNEELAAMFEKATA